MRARTRALRNSRTAWGIFQTQVKDDVDDPEGHEQDEGRQQEQAAAEKQALGADPLVCFFRNQFSTAF